MDDRMLNESTMQRKWQIGRLWLERMHNLIAFGVDRSTHIKDEISAVGEQSAFPCQRLTIKRQRV